MSLSEDLHMLREAIQYADGSGLVPIWERANDALARVEAAIARLDRIVSGHISRADRREGMVVAYDYEGEYVGCIGADTWRWLLDSGITETDVERLRAVLVALDADDPRPPYVLTPIRAALSESEPMEGGART